ncbi:MAG: family transcriptional regulator, cyclic receptor protein [Verrucomicrobiota bacterium]|jgi:CRP/FNR family transcriptional regulator, cyclic AMP receptor protein|nr:family transcriptional regulator, cyclic receptor protein [Verrucomicrobiota bacterium]MEA3205463.1 family transcriptional regulator, cyclic receptor protein [Verrucomicrobiota bacterium]
MASILELIQGGELRRFDAGQMVIEQGGKTGLLFFLVEGAVEVVKDGVTVAKSSQPGAVFGELSALLGGNHTATVRALQPCEFQVVQNPREFLELSPLVCLHVCELIARRLDALNKYLVDVKRQYEGHEHLGMVDNVLETLMHRHPFPRIKSDELKVRQIEPAD